MKGQSKKKYILNIIVILSITFLSAYFSIGDNYKEVLKTLKSANIFWVIAMIIVMLLYYVFDSFSLQAFGKAYKEDYSFIQSFRNSMSGTFFSAITPSASGGQFAQVYIFNKQGISATNSSSILVMCFICYQSVLVVYSFISVIFNFNYLMSTPALLSLVMIGFLSNFLVIFILFLGAKSKRFQNFLVNNVVKFLSKIKIVKNYEETSYKIKEYLSDFRNQLDFLQHNKPVLLRSCFFNFLKLTIVFSLPFFVSKALYLDVHFKDIFMFISYCSFIYLINAFLPIPGASGGSEACFMILFGFLGRVGASSAMTLWRFISFYIGLFLGGFIFSFDKEINGPGVNNVKIEEME